VIRGTPQALVVGKHEHDLRTRGKGMLGGNQKATFIIQGRTCKGSISPESFERFQSWQLVKTIPQAIAA
jgi:hypothetical protein